MKIIDVISSGVELGGGDESLYPLIKKLLSVWIKHQSKIFPFLLTIVRKEDEESPELSLPRGTRFISFPDDMYTAETIVLTDQLGTQCPPLQNVLTRDWDQMTRRPAVEGMPRWYHIDHINKKIEFYPTPGEDYTYYIRYKKIPQELDFISNDDDAKECDELNTGFPDPYVLVRVCAAFTYEHRNLPELASPEWQHVEKLLQEAKRGSLDNQNAAKKMRLNMGFYRQRPYWR